MKPLKTFIIVIAGILIGVAVTSLYHFGTKALCSTVPEQQRDAAVDFALAAVRQQEIGNTEQAESLEQAALSQMRSAPSQIPALWAAFQPQISKAQVSTTTVSRLLAFQATIDAALANSRQLEDFNVGWNARKQVAQLIAQQKTALVAQALRHASGLKQSIVDSKCLADAAATIDKDRHPSGRGIVKCRG